LTSYWKTIHFAQIEEAKPLVKDHIPQSYFPQILDKNAHDKNLKIGQNPMGKFKQFNDEKDNECGNNCKNQDIQPKI
jgi:hypothetical protein